MDEGKERILSEAGTLFMNMGCKGITMSSIADSLGISKRTLYEIFEDKEDLLKQSILYSIKEKERELEGLCSAAKENVLDVFLNICLSTSEESMKMRFDFVDEVKKYYPKVYEDTFGNFEENRLRDITNVIELARKQELFHKDVDSSLIAVFMIDLHDMLKNAKKPVYHLYSKRDLFYFLLIPYLKGLSTEKGVQIIEKFMQSYKPNRMMDS